MLDFIIKFVKKYSFPFALGIMAAFVVSYCSQKKEKNKAEKQVIYLHDNWQFREENTEKWYDAKVPGVVHTDLMRNKIIPDPFYRTNEDSVQWVGYRNWEYKTTFTLTEDVLNHQQIDLLFEGLDTYAEVYLNDSLVIKADNMFFPWQIQAKNLLKVGENNLYVKFFSPFKSALPMWQRYEGKLPSINEQVDTITSMYTRKAPYHYGWDWGPRLLTSGIWRPVQLVAWNSAKINNVFLRNKKVTKEVAEIEVEVEIEATEKGETEVKFSVLDEQLSFTEKVELQAGLNTKTFQVKIENPKLWWCKGLGNPYRYTTQTTLLQNGNSVDSKKILFGVRDLKLVRKPDEAGETFYFELNGKPVFAKGANYIPSHNFLTEVDSSRYAMVLNAAVDANMNTLRVWGGAVYESDLFYKMCDERGLLVWQDFMFACAFYPGHDEFLTSVAKEADYNTKRLSNYACVGLWCGNNEIGEYGWNFWGWKKKYAADSLMFFTAYDAINYNILPNAVSKNTSTAYWGSSAMSAPYTVQNTKSGDVHEWDVWFGKKSFDHFWSVVPRYASEYGLQSYPDWKTIESFTLPEDRQIESPVMVKRQKSGTGTPWSGSKKMKEYTETYYGFSNDLRKFVYLSQLMQAEGVGTALQAHRANKPHCMGSTYWQIDDCWQSISWSSIDYFGRWKALHYQAREVNKNIIAPIRRKDDKTIDVYLANDAFDTTVRVQLIVSDFAGKTLLEKDTTLLATSEKSILLYKNIAAPTSPENCIATVLVKVKDSVLYKNTATFVKVKDLKLDKSVKVTSDIKALPDGTFEIVVSSNTLAKNVFLYFDELDGFFSNNYVDVLPNQSVKVVFSPKKSTTQLPTLQYMTVQQVF